MVYVHVPYCRRKCPYCDFYSVGVKLADWQAYVNAIIREAGARIGEGHPDYSPQVNTLYIGGGTPSLMPEEAFRKLSATLIELGGVPEEFTLEVNPDDVTPEMCRVWKECGVNRISMGVQSLVDAELKVIGRRHDDKRALLAFHTLRECFDNVSLDLMFGLPGQTIASLRQTLEGFLQMRPEHVSAYSLMFEERTALTRMRNDGRISEADDTDSEAMFRMITKTLATAGYRRYEISNYALPGYESRHNSGYWRGAPYVGLGPGAHSYDGAYLRRANNPDIGAYLKNPLGSYLTETLSANDLREEMIMTRLRTAEGLDLAEYAGRFGADALATLRKEAYPSIAAGHLLDDGSRLMLTEDGIMVSDTVMASLF